MVSVGIQNVLGWDSQRMSGHNLYIHKVRHTFDSTGVVEFFANKQSCCSRFGWNCLALWADRLTGLVVHCMDSVGELVQTTMVHAGIV